MFFKILLIEVIIESSSSFKLIYTSSGVIPIELLVFKAVLLHILGVLYDGGYL